MPLEVLDKTICLQLTVSMWSGRRRLRAEDLGSAASSLPPEDLASLGSLKLCDPKRLARMSKIKRAAERACRRVCVGFLGGFATDESNVQALVAQLETHQKEFQTEATAFANDFQDEINAWTTKHPRWKDVIRRALPNPAHVIGRLQFGFQAFRIAPAAEEPSAAVNGGLIKATGGLADQLFREIAMDARVAWERSYHKKDCVGQKALGPIRAIKRKLESLQYLDGRCRPLMERIAVVLSSLPKEGPIENSDLSAVVGLLYLLKDAQAMRAHGAAVLQEGEAVREAVLAEVNDEYEFTDAAPVLNSEPVEAPVWI